jgi:hypothetical protein
MKMIKSKRMMGSACSMYRKMRNAHKVWSENLKGRGHLKDFNMIG